MSMTGRERLQAVMHKQPADRLAWTTLVDNNTLSVLPEGLRGNGGLDFYRHLGCDIFLLDCWNMPYNFRAPVLVWPDWAKEESVSEGEITRELYHTPAGTLSRVWRKSHPVEYPVKSIADVDLWCQMWAGARYVPADDGPIAARVDADLGPDGIATRFWGPSTIPRLLELDIGTMNFYYLLRDHPDEIEALISAMHEKELQAFAILAQAPSDVIILAENTSTYYISPAVYRKYNKPAIKDFVDLVHGAGKVALVHMCGHVKALLADFKDTGMDGVHALTPPPTGNTPWELALDVMGEDTVIVGALDPTIHVAGPIDEIPEALDRLYTPRLRRANFVLCPFADGIPVQKERFEAVAKWMEKQGRRFGQ
jgi:hypothetical protein